MNHKDTDPLLMEESTTITLDEPDGVPPSSPSVATISPSMSNSSTPGVNHHHTNHNNHHNNHVRTDSTGSPNFHTIRNEANFMRVMERNVDYLKLQFEEFFASRASGGNSLFVPVICSLLLILYFVDTIAWHLKSRSGDGGDSADADPAFDKNLPFLVKRLTISPKDLLIPYNWLFSVFSLFTYPLVELYFYQVVIDVVVITLGTTLIDPLWGRKELVRFFIIINVCVGLLSIVHYILIYVFKGDSVYLYGVTIYGLTGYMGASAVTVKQLLPESVILSTGIGKFKNNLMPLVSLMVTYALYLLGLTSGVSVITLFYGIVTSWIYLRFYQFHPTNGTKGDMSEGFSFYTFFPSFLQPIVSIMADVTYSIMVKVGCCTDYGNSIHYQGMRELGERLTDNFRLPLRRVHKYHPSGDYNHLRTPSSGQPPAPAIDL